MVKIPNYSDITLNLLLTVLKHRHSNLHKWSKIILNKEFNVRVIMLALMPHPKYISTGTNPNLNLHDIDNSDGMIYASFNLVNINAPGPPKWKHNYHILEEYKKFHHSCQ